MVRIPTRNQTKFAVSYFAPTLGAGPRKVLVSAPPILANFFKEMKMSKRRVQGTLVTVLLFAAVAVFPTIVQALSSKKANCKSAASEFGATGVLIADGGDPVPGPSPIPWPRPSA